MIKATNIKKRYGKLEVLKGVDIEINKDNVVLKDWYYFTQYGPEHTIGLTLRDLEVAKSVYEEEELTKDWSILE